MATKPQTAPAGELTDQDHADQLNRIKAAQAKAKAVPTDTKNTVPGEKLHPQTGKPVINAAPAVSKADQKKIDKAKADAQKAKDKAKADKEKAKVAADAKKAADKVIADAAKEAEAKRIAAERKDDERTLSTLGKSISVRVEKINKLDSQADDHRVSAALEFANARQICVKHKIDFETWAKENVPELSFQSVRKLAKAGESGEVEKATLAIADMRDKNKAANQKARDKKKADADKDGEGAPEVQTGLEVMQSRFLDLSPEKKVAFLQWAADNAGLKLVAPAD